MLLEGLGLQFRILPADVDETVIPGVPQEQMACRLAEMKATSVYYLENSKESLIIAADTLVCVDEEILGKPVDADDAVRILKKISGRMHKVITGVCLRLNDRQEVFNEVTEVWFKKLTDEEISYYLDHYRPFDKAGAYGIQEWIGYIGIEKISGCFYNVMGLPVKKVYEAMIRLTGLSGEP